MKKKKIFIIVFLMIFICIPTYAFIRMAHPNMKAIVLECNGNNYLFVMDIKTKTPYYIGLPENMNIQFKDGQEIIVYFNCPIIIQESYPASISSEFVKTVKILKEKSNIRNIPRNFRINI